jgi:Glycosyl transferase family 11
MIVAVVNGGLGNQLFQIFHLLSYVLDAGATADAVSFGFVHQLSSRTTTYWDTLFASLRPFVRKASQIRCPPFVEVQEREFQYHPLDPPFSHPLPRRDFLIEGYFQSPRYFAAQEERILRFLRFDKQRREVLSVAKERPGMLPPWETTVSLHVRRGDFISLADKHPLLPAAYYQRALETVSAAASAFKPLTHVLLFCEDAERAGAEAEVLRPLREATAHLRLTWVWLPPASVWSNEVTQLWLMTACRHHIIANSTFSWWGAYLDPRRRTVDAGVTCYPSVWFGPALSDTKDTRDLFPTDLLLTTARWVCVDATATETPSIP